MTPLTGDPRVLLPQQITKDDVIYVRALVSHPMYTGMSRAASGALIPEYYIKQVTVHYGDDEVARFTWTSGISKDPYVAFPLRATREAPLTIRWTDTRGLVYTQTADVRFTA